jgi:hypothetical protein
VLPSGSQLIVERSLTANRPPSSGRPKGPRAVTPVAALAGAKTAGRPARAAAGNDDFKMVVSGNGKHTRTQQHSNLASA